MKPTSSSLLCLPSLLGVTLLLGTLGACAPEDGGRFDGDALIESTEQSLNVAEPYLSRSNGIPVCFLDPAGQYESLKAEVRATVTANWQRISLLRFTGWGQCPSTATKGVRIAFRSAEQGGSSVVGTDVARTDPSMWLPTTWSGSDCGGPDRCRQAVTVHEFGHAIGYHHEQGRSDTPQWCRDQLGGTGTSPNATHWGAWDADSIMNYCNWAPSQPTPLMTATDISGTVSFYGSPAEAKASTVFDPSVYLDVHPDLVAAYGPTNYPAAEAHWLEFGPIEGRLSSLTFDVQYYVPKYPAVSNAVGVNVGRAIAHYVRTGLPQGLSGSPVFDPKYYLARYADLRAAFGSTGYVAAANHYRTSGIHEGRRASLEFDPVYYLANNADVRNAYGANNRRAAALHYMVIGRRAGLRGAL